MNYGVRYRNDSEWTAEKLAAIPGAWRERVSGLHQQRLTAAAKIAAGTGRRSDAERSANLWLSETAERMHVIRVPLNLSDAELCQLARECAATVFDIAQPGTVTDTGTLRKDMGNFVRRYGIEPPPDTVTDTGAIRRMGDDIWWRRRLRVAQGRALEREAIALGYVHRNKEIYASTATVERRKQQKKRNADALERTSAVNQYGQEFTLAELAERAVSNPRIRRGELMTRISGFEAVARSLGHVGMFFTQTCPSRMHPKKSANGKVFDNPKFDGTTPRQAQKYLVTVWARVRAALARAGAAVYGFRIAEPHHDATPHWHLLLFMAAEVKDTVCRIFASYACEEDAEELNTKEAKKARFYGKAIDWSRGSAAGYVAKYVSKNIDGGGYQVQGDIEGSGFEAVTPSHRVEAWASTWGVRQFQQIGGAPVGVWRELRRMKADDATATLEAARSAADVGNWARYIEVMGLQKRVTESRLVVQRQERWSKPSKHGVIRVLPVKFAVKDVKRWPLEVAWTRPGERYDAEAGEALPAPPNRYGEESARAIYGVRDVGAGKAFCSRVFRWEVKRNGLRRTVQEFEVASRFRGDRGGDGDGFAFDFGGVSRPWTRVNNCTEGKGNAVQKSGGQSEIRSESAGEFASSVDSSEAGTRSDHQYGRCPSGTAARDREIART